MTGSDTLGLVLMQVGYANKPHEKQAGGIPWGKLFGKTIPAVERGAVSSLERTTGGLAHTAEGFRIPKIPGTATYKPTGIGGAESAATKLPRLFRKGVPIQTATMMGTKGIGGWLDRGANSGWIGRAATAIPRAILPGKGLYGAAGFTYGIGKYQDAKAEGERLDEATSFAAANAIRQMRGLSPLERFGAMFMGDDTVAGYLRKKNPGVARQFLYQRDNPDYERDFPTQAAIRSRIPYYPTSPPPPR
jgi:hypothetical protein